MRVMHAFSVKPEFLCLNINVNQKLSSHGLRPWFARRT